MKLSTLDRELIGRLHKLSQLHATAGSGASGDGIFITFSLKQWLMDQYL